MQAYYATKLSPNMSRTPNGFLICKNVPIARTGEQEYLGSEIGIGDREDDLIKVLREEDEVFSPETLASFEGAIFCDEHPPNDVTTQNVQYLQRGFVKDVRRGQGDDAGKILADIIVTDPITIAAIEGGKREISCGYKCDYAENEDGMICQRNIRGNHVALVDKGRAGQDVAIKDAEPEAPIPNTERRIKFMKKPVNKKTTEGRGILSKFFGMLTTDADPEVVAEIAEQLIDAVEEDVHADEEPKVEVEEEKRQKAEPPDEGKAKDDEIPSWAAQILERLDRVEAACSSKAPDSAPLSELEEGFAEEERVTKPVEGMDEESEDDGAALDEDTSDGEAPKSEASDEALRKAIRDAKTVVAGIKDPKQRKIVSDSMAKLIRQTYGVKPSTPKGSYAAINAAKAKTAAKTSDSAVSLEARQKAYDARNPHIKKD